MHSVQCTGHCGKKTRTHGTGHNSQDVDHRAHGTRHTAHWTRGTGRHGKHMDTMVALDQCDFRFTADIPVWACVSFVYRSDLCGHVCLPFAGATLECATTYGLCVGPGICNRKRQCRGPSRLLHFKPHTSDTTCMYLDQIPFSMWWQHGHCNSQQHTKNSAQTISPGQSCVGIP